MKTAIYFISIVLVQITSCKRQHIDLSPESKSSIICINDSSLYKNIYNNLVYKDSVDAIFLKIKNDINKLDSTNLNECQKLPYSYIHEVDYKDSLEELKKIIDINSFNKIYETNFYRDKNYIYVFQDNPATYPPLKIIDINPNKAEIIKTDNIKDDKNVYFLGIKVSNNAKDFKYIPNKEGILLFADNKKIIWNWSQVSKDDFLNIILPESTKDSLKKIYFPNK